MSSLCVECRNRKCNAVLVLPSWSRGGHQRFDDQTRAVGELRLIERHEMAVDLYNGTMDLDLDAPIAGTSDIPFRLKPRSFPVTCSKCNRTYLYDHRDAFLASEPGIEKGLRP